MLPEKGNAINSGCSRREEGTHVRRLFRRGTPSTSKGYSEKMNRRDTPQEQAVVIELLGQQREKGKISCCPSPFFGIDPRPATTPWKVLSAGKRKGGKGETGGKLAYLIG